ncbi:MAG: response regulator [Actinomycetota bacterium]|nr:response regulator [Actinomycetota bacterium]
MTEILVASDAGRVRDQLTSVLAGPETTIVALDRGPAVLPAIQAHVPDLVVLDLQMGNMGGMAICLDLRLEERAGRVKHTPVLMLLDRRADVFLARRSQADGWLIRPLDPIRIRRAVGKLLDGGTYFDESYKPNPVLAAPAVG